MPPVKVVVDVVLGVALGGAWCAQMARWLRVLQREHYDPSSLLRFLGRWSSPPRASAAHGGVSSRRPITLSHVLIVAIVAAVVFAQWDLAVAFTALYGLLCPVGLALRGRTASESGPADCERSPSARPSRPRSSPSWVSSRPTPSWAGSLRCSPSTRFSTP